MIAPPTCLDDFLDKVSVALRARAFDRVVLAGPRGQGDDLLRIIARRIELKGQPALSLVYRHKTRDVTKNFPVQEGLQQLRDALIHDFDNAHLHSGLSDIQLARSRKGRWSLRTGTRPALEEDAESGASAGTLAHNREKRRFIQLGRPFLTLLGVTDAQGRLIPAMSRKWKQINKFLEVFSHAWADVSRQDGGARAAPRVLDYGAGKGYLTFAMHDFLREELGLAAEVTGVELREELVRLCNTAVHTLGLQGLHFVQGDVLSHAPGQVDVMIALHACDVATDHALHAGVRSGAAIIMCAPCCHKQLRPQLLSPHPLAPILQYGVHLGQEAEMLTDGLRALLLQACGYDTQVFEFVANEHTSKNKMILAVKRASAAPRAEVLEQIREIKRFYAIREHCLERLLVGEGILPVAA